MGFEFSKRGMSRSGKGILMRLNAEPPRSLLCNQTSEIIQDSNGASTDAFHVSILRLALHQNSGDKCHADTRPCGHVDHLDLKGTFGHVEI